MHFNVNNANQTIRKLSLISHDTGHHKIITMATQAAVHKRNLESSILFMQTEHAQTLKGLHEEIKNLQKKCSDLTFQLNMQGIGDDSSGTQSAQIEELKKEIQDQIKERAEYCQELQRKDKQIKHLETDVKRTKIKHQEELRKRSEWEDKLRADLESKSNQVAYLTTELHKLKRLQLESASKQTYIANAHGLVPAPPGLPKERMSGIRRGHRGMRKPEPEEIHPVRTGSGSTSRSDSPVLEAARSFIERDEVEPEIRERKLPTLPPIKAATNERHVMFQKVVQPSHRKKHVEISQEVQVIAVDHMPTKEQKWATHAQESRSSEMN